MPESEIYAEQQLPPPAQISQEELTEKENRHEKERLAAIRVLNKQAELTEALMNNLIMATTALNYQQIAECLDELHKKFKDARYAYLK